MECDFSKLPKCLQMFTEAFRDVWTHGVETGWAVPGSQASHTDFGLWPVQGFLSRSWLGSQGSAELKALAISGPCVVSFLLLSKLWDNQEKKGWCCLAVWGVLISCLTSLARAWDERIDDGEKCMGKETCSLQGSWETERERGQDKRDSTVPQGHSSNDLTSSH